MFQNAVQKHGFTPFCVHWQHFPLDRNSTTGWKEAAQLPVIDSALPISRVESPMSGLCFGRKKVGFWSTPLSQLCSEDLGGGCEIQCKTCDGDGFIPVWEAKAPTTLLLTLKAPTWLQNYISMSKLLCLLLVLRSLLSNTWLCWIT